MSIYKEIDIEKNGVIEASAGTGKTYTIENFVIRILKEKRIFIDGILLVTFTEKAAGELRTRIREVIEEEINRSANLPNEKEFFEACLIRLNTAMIGTIHGFCNSVLKNFAFESHSPFEFELVAGEVVVNQAIKKAIRNEVAEMFKSNFESIADFLELEDIVKKVKEILPKFRPGFDFFEPTIIESIDSLLSKINKIRIEYDICNEELDHCIEGEETKILGYFNPKCKKLYDAIKEKSRDAVLKVLKNTRRAPLENIPSNNLTHDDEVLVNAEKKLLEFVKRIVEYENSLDVLKNNIKLKIVHEVTKVVHKRVADIKNDHSLLTYSDMITTVAYTLNEPNSHLSHILSAKYEYCIIDEFQDTSSLQWSIFKKIFLQQKSPAEQKNKIYIVGDPKQSIYSFQGSDLNSYYAAKKTILDEYGGKFYKLDDNFRSHSDIINVCNKIFSFQGYVGSEGLDKEIWGNFVESGYGDGSKQREMVYKTGSRVTVYKYHKEKKEKKEVVRGLFYDTIAHEIERIRGEFNRFSDIAILTGTNREADNIRTVLIKRGIDSVKYKQTGFFQSKFMLEFILVLDAICFPTNIVKVKQALCTNFFFGGIDRDKLADISQNSEIFYELKVESVEKNWAKFFSTLMHSANFRVNISKLNASDKNLREAFLRQVVKFCIAFLRKNSSMLEELLEKLKNYFYGIETPPDGEDCFEAPMQNDAVQVMTIHASKGLQFSVVFVCFDPDDPDKLKATYPMFINLENGKRAIALDSQTDALSKTPLAAVGKYERLAENKRLYYVALTRACEKLYLFIPEAEGEKNLASLAIDNALTTICGEVAIKEIVISLGQNGERAKRDETTKQNGDAKKMENSEVVENSYDWVVDRKTHIHSYTSIVHKVLKENLVGKGGVFGEAKSDDASDNIFELTEIKDNEYIGFDDFKTKREEYKNLETGSESGNILHKVFEEIDFNVASSFESAKVLEKDKNFCKVVEPILTSYSKDFSYKPHIASIVHNSLNAVIEIGGESFTIGAIKQENIVREMEFYHYNSNSTQSAILKGYIDLVFFHNCKYYILDWKSNMLEGYSEDKIVESMEESGYFMQADLYANALTKWLKGKVKNFFYESNFGGVVYVYLRGTKSGTNSGIYTFKPAEKDIDAFAESVMLDGD